VSGNTEKVFIKTNKRLSKFKNNLFLLQIDFF
jgi:hypothetical protein